MTPPDHYPVGGRGGLTRRTLLRGAGLLAVGAVSGCSSDSLFGRDRPSGAARYQLGMATPELLERERVEIVRGVMSTEYAVPRPPAATTYDLRSATFRSYHDKDAVYETGEFSEGSTPQERNHRPVRIGHERPGEETAVVGGVVVGQQPEDLTWIRMKYGQQVQDDTDAWVEAGRGEDEDPYAAIEDNANQDGDLRVHVAEGSWAVLDGVQVRNTHDGIGLYGIDGDDGAGRVFIRNCYLQDIHDDAIENDEWQDLHVLDTLVERAYGFLSVEPSEPVLQRSRRSDRTQVVEDCVVVLSPFPGGHKRHSSDRTHSGFVKFDENSPAVDVRSTVLVASRFITPAAAELPARRVKDGHEVTDTYEDVTIVWTGRGRYPGNVPDGCRVTDDPAVADKAVARWKERHGVVDLGELSDPDLLLAPRT